MSNQDEFKNYLLASGLILASVILLDQFIKLTNTRIILEACKRAFGELDEIQQQSIKDIVQAFKMYGDGDTKKLAYILATARHESNFRPIRERRAKSTQTKVYNLQNRYWSTGYYGRGFVQLTWENNYKKMSNFLGVDFVQNPDLVLNSKYAAKILVYGMMNGSFTRKKLGAYINGNSSDYYHARKVVNGMDRAERIKGYALDFMKFV